MGPESIAIGVTPETTAMTVAFVVAGIALGTFSGLTPGLHANNFALLLAGFAPTIPAPPLFVGAAMLAAGVTHTFLDVIPALALGVPDPAMAPTALPGHKLVIQGRGREAIRLSALGSLLAVGFAIPLAVPVTLLMTRVYPTIAGHLTIVLGIVAILMVLSERSPTARAGAAITFLASGILGVLTLDISADGVLPVGDMLAPLFAGLFGAPILLEALSGTGVPPQADKRITTPGSVLLPVAFVGTISGALVGYLPGISSAIAASAALIVLPHRGPRSFVIASSGVNTANTIFALFALVALGNPRTGVLVALDGANVPLNLPVLLGSVGIAAGVAFGLVLLIGDRYLAFVGTVDNVALSLAVLGFLAILVVAFAGLLGFGVFLASTAVGLLPARFGSRRMTCMGVLLLPLIL